MITEHRLQAQFPIPEGVTETSRNQRPSDVLRYGSLEVTWVRSALDGQKLFEIASPTVYDRSPDAAGQGVPVEQRADEIEAKLQRAITQIRDRETLSVEVSRLHNASIIDVKDKDYTRPLVLVTVTDIDADYHGQSIDQLAEAWRDIIQKDLERRFDEFSGDVLLNSLQDALWGFLGLIGLTVASWGIKRFISRQQKALRQYKRDLNVSAKPGPLVDPQHSTQADSQDENPDEALVQQRNQFLRSLTQTLSVDRQLAVWGLMQWFLFWGIILTWCVGIYFILRRIPILATWSSGALAKPLELLSIWFFTGLAIRISRRLIDRFRTNWQEQEIINFIDLGDAQRRKLRISTIAGAAKGMVTVLIAIIAILTALETLGISTGSVLAIGGLFGLAISFGSQSLVKDLVNGFLILAEDQYAIGDVIDVGSASGLVENLNLRVTQLRSADGELVTLPNSAITEVKNMTRSWSRVNFRIEVAYQTDPEKALSVLKDVAQELYDDPEWRDKILTPPDVLGIDSVSHSGMTITTWIQTAPMQQWAVGREFRLRIRKALEENGIEIGVPQQAYVAEPSEPDASNGRVQEVAEGSDRP